MSTRQPSRVVFVGNIPYGLTEEQITDLFAGAGRVVSFRLVYDRETGRPKGFGFAEFPDYDSAASAVRNLNDHEIMGRKLRVDFSNETGNDDDKDGTAPQSYAAPSNGNAPIAAPAPTASSSLLPPLPKGTELNPGQSAFETINQTLQTLSPAQLLDILQSMKQLATNDPARAIELLDKAPQLSYAIFQALLIMGLVPPEAIHSVLEPGSAIPPLGVPVGPPPSAAYGGFPGATSTPPVAVGGYAPPHVAPAPAPAPASAPGAPPGQDELIEQLLSLPQDVIDNLPENEKAQVLALRAQFAGMQQRR
ncbi:hypothetical protein QBC38DRAFT_469079 [Podospora fimiseda]|uniref:RRM domain-containing protein n=1 Tax=Podospora fimiseda TaxID=252190 RepID=A0AAN7BVY3_9PEZI|nr:hypothetical protein QBC38DRAFT_469079 [Podospora fimiseda]